MTYTTLISTQDLQALLDQGCLVVDCRFNLLEPAWGRADYLTAHLPGAIFADLDQDLAGARTPTSGRHPLPERERILALFSAWGIEPGKQVVVYDTISGGFAVRLWWLLRFYGHAAAAVLDGGLQKWQAEGRPIESGPVTPTPGRFIPGEALEQYVDTAGVEDLLGDPAYRIIDARATPRYLGLVEPIDPVAGHIPGAVNRFHALNLAPDGTMLPPDELKKQFLALLGPVPADHAIVYCGSGVTSCHHLLAMAYAGLPQARLYLGSWSEWCRSPRLPVATGSGA